MISQELYIIWLSFVVYKCKMIISPGLFFYFFKNLFLWVVRRVKGQKMVQNDKKNFVLCTLYLRNHIYIIWSWLMVHMCKRIISPGTFYIFFNFYILGSVVGYKSKKWPKMTKIMSVTPYLSKHTLFDCAFCGTSLKWCDISRFFYHFFQNFGFLAKNFPKWLSHAVSQ